VTKIQFKLIIYQKFFYSKIVLLSCISFFILTSCNNTIFEISEINAENIKISSSNEENEDLENLIEPYRKKINNLKEVIGYAKNSMTVRDGVLESSLGNFLADILLTEVNLIFTELSKNQIDFCILNMGGVRANINEGIVTQHDLFKVMPFENKAVVIKITGKDVLNLVNFINEENKAHPISGLKIVYNKNELNNVLIKNKVFDITKNYLVLTSDFLHNGGDNMYFLESPIEKFELNLYIRDAFINGIKRVDTLYSKKDKRIIRI
tara:strand:+ start:307 stop:1101 length:795 start_codon:yes stop_codon:yes gene_type:complete